MWKVLSSSYLSKGWYFKLFFVNKLDHFRCWVWRRRIYCILKMIRSLLNKLMLTFFIVWGFNCVVKCLFLCVYFCLSARSSWSLSKRLSFVSHRAAFLASSKQRKCFGNLHNRLDYCAYSLHCTKRIKKNWFKLFIVFLYKVFEGKFLAKTKFVTRSTISKQTPCSNW